MEEIIKKLDDLDAKFDTLDAKVDALDTKVEKGVKENDQKFDRIFGALDEHTSQIDLLARTAADHTGRLERIEDKLDNLEGIENKIDKIMNVLDDMAGLGKKHDDEIVVINHNHRVLDRRVEVLEQKI